MKHDRKNERNNMRSYFSEKQIFLKNNFILSRITVEKTLFPKDPKRRDLIIIIDPKEIR
jgi:hypothetical protein